MPESMNSMLDIKNYLSGEGQKPLETAEFVEFWKNLSEEEREQFKNTPLTV